MRARYKGPAGTGTLSLNDDATVEDIFHEIKSKSGIAKFTLKYGWPLKTLDRSRGSEVAKTIGLNGETFTMIPDETASAGGQADPTQHPGTQSGIGTTPASAPTASVSFSGMGGNPNPSFAGPGSFSTPQPPTKGPEAVTVPWPEREGTLLLRVMPDDNSCLFTAFGGALQGRQLQAPDLRKMVAEYILTHTDEYNEAILAVAPEKYAEAIQGKDRWGGAIELGIFSDLFDIQVCAFDVKSQNMLSFGENKETRCILVYSGIHYDRVGFSYSDPPYKQSNLQPELDCTVWNTTDEEVLAKTLQLISELNAMHYYTDPSEILLRCDVPGCGWLGSGERAGAIHAQETGHTALSEVDDNALMKCNTPGCDWLGSGEAEAKKHTSDSGHVSMSVIPDYDGP